MKQRAASVVMAAALAAGLYPGAPAGSAAGAETGRESGPELPALVPPFLHVQPRSPQERRRIAQVTAPPRDFSAPEPFEGNPGGAATVRARAGADAFSQPSGNMSFARELEFKLGNGLFKKLWVSSPSSTLASDGLGPLFNARSCQRCHLKDGRGHPPEPGAQSAGSLVLRVSVPAAPGPGQARIAQLAEYLGSLPMPAPRGPDPVYGGQIQDLSVQGHPGEGRVALRYEEETVSLAGGQEVSLRRPVYRLASPAYGPLAEGAVLSPRVAPPMIGLGLLEAVPAEDILAWADPQDADGDGISGRAQLVWSREQGRPLLGRFGWKAGAPTIREQAAAAFATDIGISTPLLPEGWGDCTGAQSACRAAPHGGHPEAPEADAQALDLVAFYSRNLAVPARRDADDPQVLAGKELFHGAGCAACHRPKFVTHRLPDQPEQSFQLIWPMTDLLLHDMGPGLADGAAEGLADGREWRTAPLWGLGMTRRVNGHSQLLHDGRARSILEAVLWHGGEARAARARVVAMPPEDRAALIRYLESL